MRGIGSAAAAILAAGLLGASPAGAARLPPVGEGYDLKGAVAYADLCVSPETEDVDGLRVFVRPAGKSPRVLAQLAEGGLGQLRPAPSRVVAGELHVEVPGDAPEVRFHGRIARGKAVFRSEAREGEPFTLRRTADWAYAPWCRPR